MDYTEYICNRSSCPALGTVEVDIHGQDFRFCQHDYNELEPLLLVADVKRAQPQQDLVDAVSEMAN